MKQKDRRFRPHGLRARLGLSLLISTVICVIVFFMLSTSFEYLFANYYERSDFERIHKQRQIESLQSYIDTNQVSTTNVSLLRNWERKQPVLLLELYSDGDCIYSSTYDAPFSSYEPANDAEHDNQLRIELTDCTVEAYIFSDFTYQFYVIETAVAIVAALVLFILLFLHNSQNLIRYICRLNEEVQILEGGNLEYHVSEEGNDEITELARSMNRMRVTLQQQMETEQNLHQSHLQLVTEMSHDLRTPLTGIMLYLEILRTHRYDTPEQLEEYLEKIDAKAHHMKLLTDHLFEYSMQGTQEKQTEPLTMELTFEPEIRNMQDDLRTLGYNVVSLLSWENCFVAANPEYIHRIFENIISNVEKYAEPAADVIVEALSSNRYCGISVMNTTAVHQTPAEHNGVGIESIRSMMKQMGGICNVEQTEATFDITIMFPKL